jgi:4-alpha-glucanotransferase
MTGTRSAALLIPLSAVRTRAQAGIGEITDIPALAEFARSIGCSTLLFLPLGEPCSGDASPYGPRSAAALDPIYVGMGPLSEAKSTSAPRVDFSAVRAAKARALKRAFAEFCARGRVCIRESEYFASDFERFLAEEAYWLEDYALFRALEDAHEGASWQSWPAPLRERENSALDSARRLYGEKIRFYGFCQWVAGTQWRAAREAARARGVRIAGDLPFMVALSSADVWARRENFRLDATIGAPPDALGPKGQDWGLPAYRWEVLARTDYGWIRERARRMADLYDLYRVDHVVGYYRTYVIERAAGRDATTGQFFPGDEPAQRAQGEAVLEAMRAAGAGIIAEDLGTIPPFVRESLVRLGIPGYRVLRWERRWHAPGEPFIDPIEWPPLSVATSGTHDTTTLAVWWESEIGPAERAMLAPGAGAAFTPEVHERLIELLLRAGSDLALFPIQDILGARDRINVPGIVSEENWTYRLPFLLEDAWSDPAVRPRLESFARLARTCGRA